MLATEAISSGEGKAQTRLPHHPPRLALGILLGTVALIGVSCASGATSSPRKVDNGSDASASASTAMATPQPFRFDNLFVVTGVDDGHTLRLHVGDTLLVRLAGSHVIGAVLYAEPQTADWHSLVPIPDPQCPDVASVEHMLEQSGASTADAQGLAAAVGCQHQLFGSGEAFAAFRAVGIGTARVTAQALDQRHPPFEVSFQIVGQGSP